MHRITTSFRKAGLTAAVAGVALAAMALTAVPVEAQKAWRASFGTATTIKSAGEYRGVDGEPQMHFESFSPLDLEPSVSATFNVVTDRTRKSLSPDGTGNHVVFKDTKPAVVRNPDGPPFYKRAEGTISAFAWVPGKFSDVKVTAEVNVAAGGKGTTSRQGPMARWDNGNNHYWFYVNFSTGKFGIVRSRFFGVLMDDLPGSAGPVRDFANTKPYYLEFEVVGNTAHGWVYDQDPGSGKRRLVGDTGPVVDPDPFPAGVSGLLVEKWIDSPFDPLEGSFANLTSTSVASKDPKPSGTAN